MNDFTKQFTSFFDHSEPAANSHILVAFIVGAVLVFPPLWSYTRNVLTIAHEGGHAFMAFLWGRRLSGIRLHNDTSGLTITKGKPRGLGVIFTMYAGYTIPAALSLLFAYTLNLGYASLTILGLGLFSFVMLILIRNLWGLFILLLTLGSIYALLAHAPVESHSLIVASMAGFFGVASLKALVELQLQRFGGESEGSDIDQLQSMTHIPADIWWILMLCTNLACYVYTIILLFYTR